jgi:hypothetical protein
MNAKEIAPRKTIIAAKRASIFASPSKVWSDLKKKAPKSRHRPIEQYYPLAAFLP